MFGIGVDGYDINLENISVKNTSGSYGINIQDGKSVLKNVKIEKDSGIALSLENGDNNLSFINLVGSSYSGYGLLANEGNFVLDNIKSEGYDKAIILAKGPAVVSNSIITNNKVGVEVHSDYDGIVLSNNSIFGNQEYGVLNFSEFAVIARNNWWGDAFGPNDGSEEYFGIGDYVSGEVDYSDHLVSNPFSLAFE